MRRRRRAWPRVMTRTWWWQTRGMRRHQRALDAMKGWGRR